MKLMSSAFEDGGMIPKQYTCDGINYSPPLKWYEEPESTQTFAIICDDPDAPSGSWVHWIVYNIPSKIHELSEKLPTSEVLPNGIHQGLNDFRKIGYGGPCPPNGTHRYFFRIYALSKKLNFKAGLTKSELLKKMKGNILSEELLIGKYKR